MDESPAINTPIMKTAKNIVELPSIGKAKDETIGSRETMRHPGPIIYTNEITTKEKQWMDVGSGVFARTSPQSDRLIRTTRAGPPIEDIHRRTI